MKFALVGDPVDHSRSPALHERFLDEADIAGSYAAVRVERGEAAAALRRLQHEGYAGCNVTFPLKEEAAKACDRLTDEARRARSVNTVFFGRQILGATTDGLGARIALETLLDEPIALKRVGVLGYGATARAILGELHDNDAYAFVWGRNAAAVDAVCTTFEAAAWPSHEPPEIVISTLPPDAELPPSVIDGLRRADVVMDANYGQRTTLARRLHREVIEGDAMLEAQARASFDFWLTQLQLAGE